MLNFVDNQQEIKIFESQNYLLENFWNLLDFHSQDLVATLIYIYYHGKIIHYCVKFYHGNRCNGTQPNKDFSVFKKHQVDNHLVTLLLSMLIRMVVALSRWEGHSVGCGVSRRVAIQLVIDWHLANGISARIWISIFYQNFSRKVSTYKDINGTTCFLHQNCFNVPHNWWLHSMHLLDICWLPSTQFLIQKRITISSLNIKRCRSITVKAQYTLWTKEYRRVKIAKKWPFGGKKKDSTEIYTNDTSGYVE